MVVSGWPTGGANTTGKSLALGPLAVMPNKTLFGSTFNIDVERTDGDDVPTGKDPKSRLGELRATELVPVPASATIKVPSVVTIE